MKIVCIGRNFLQHINELSNKVPSEPVIFMKPKSAIAFLNKHIKYPRFTEELEYEAEVVLKISKNGSRIPESEARNFFNEWTIGVDLTARDIQRKLKNEGLPWEKAKAFDNSAIIGDFVSVPFEELYDSYFELYKNEEQVQIGRTDDMIFSFEKIISYASQFFRLQMGDLIFTGTPAGTGMILPYDNFEGKLNGATLLQFTVI
ncbi:MAG TPA: fumarylacetoacetate hydrolase family protein [Edaphocola sp.]|nr:fumarylacetoacetate hydrolase family protein [Edaphocola sp.]